jgi:hypothetical protein
MRLLHCIFFFKRGIDTTSLSSFAFITICLLAEGLISGIAACNERARCPQGFLVVSLDSDDEDKDWDAPDTSQDEEITRKLFGDLNHDLLGPPDDGKEIVVSDFKE